MFHQWSQGINSSTCHDATPKTWLEACDRAKEVEIVINAQTKRPLFTTHPSPLVVTTPQLICSPHPQVIP
jgi:hypothetical protein